MSTARTLRFASGAGHRLWGLTAEERLKRQAAAVKLAVSDGAQSGEQILIRADAVLTDSMLKHLMARPPALILDEAGAAIAAVAGQDDQAGAMAALEGDLHASHLPRVAQSELGMGYDITLRTRADRYIARLTPETADEIEKRVFMSTYKGATDIVTKYCWPWPARHVTRWCAALGITPNQVTFLSFLCVLGAMWLFWNGQFGWGLVSAWMMTFLDTVDGKLARVTVTSSWWGNIFDHGVDLVHPPFWYWAWVVGLLGWGGLTIEADILWGAFWLILAMYLLGRGIEGLFIRLYDMHIHVWRETDFHFRTITARRNPNFVILTLAALIHKPDWGLLIVAAWCVLSNVFHAVRLVQALASRKPIRSFLSEAG